MRFRPCESLIGLAALAAVVLSCSCVTDSGGMPPRGQKARKSAPRPDVVVVLVDTLRPDKLPFYGYDENTAPFLSGLARRGVVFENAFSTCGWTSPSVASLFTSLFPTQQGLVFGRDAPRGRGGKRTMKITRIPDDLETMAEVLRGAGYGTFAVVDNLLVDARRNFDQGFDRFDHFRYVNAENINAHLMTLREEILAARPYFLYVHYMDPHLPYHQRQLGAEAPPLHFGEGTLEEILAAYDSEIRFLDRHVEALYEAFGMDDETLFVFTSDHGDEFMDHGGYGHAHTLYQELIHVPLLVHAPASFKARRVAGNVSLVDVLPTLRDFLQLEPGRRDQGISLLPFLRRKSKKLPERLLYAHTVGQRTGEMHSVVDGEWKLIHSSRAEPLLFDLERDPQERNSLIEARPQTTKELALAMVDFQKRARTRDAEVEDLAVDDETLQQLKALGYAN